MSWKQWPFYPERLTDIIDQSLAEFMQSGASERLRRYILIVERGEDGQLRRIPPLNERQNFQDFCSYLRDQVPGANETCTAWDFDCADRVLQSNDTEIEVYLCPMGLLDLTASIIVAGKPVAVIFTGQFRPMDSSDTNIREAVDKLGTLSKHSIEDSQDPVADAKTLGSRTGFGIQSSLRSECSHSAMVDEAIKEKLKDEIQKLHPYNEEKIEAFRTEVNRINDIVQRQYTQRKRGEEENFLKQVGLQMMRVQDMEGFHEGLTNVLADIVEFCGVEYAISFLGREEGDYILSVADYSGLPDDIVKSGFPSFIWETAGLLLENYSGISEGDLTPQGQARLRSGIKGANSKFFRQASCMLPFNLGDAYRGLLLLGPFRDPAADRQVESRFLIGLASSTGLLVLSLLQMMNMKQMRERSDTTAKIIAHQVRASLNPIVSELDLIQDFLNGEKYVTKQRSKEAIATAQEEAEILALQSTSTLGINIAEMDFSDYDFQPYSLAQMVSKCVERRVRYAEEHSVGIQIASSVWDLPDAEIDTGTFNIALTNIIDNAIKYSHQGKVVRVYSRSDEKRAYITVEDFGLGIMDNEKERIFERGYRAKIRGRPQGAIGQGIGLWLAILIVKMHGGDISVESYSGARDSQFSGPGEGYVTRFTISIPLKHRD